MSEANKNVLDFTNEGQPKVTGMLNVLTILTIIGSILGLISGIYSYLTAEKSYLDLKKSIDSPEMQKAPDFVKNMMTPEMLEMTRKAFENRLPIMILTLVGSALCLYGALEMRKLKKQGYMIWLVGEVLPIIGMLVFLGTAAISGFGLISLVFPAIFVILYTVYKKDLIY